MIKDIQNTWRDLSRLLNAEVDFKEIIQSHIRGYLLKISIRKSVNDGVLTISQIVLVDARNNANKYPVNISYLKKSSKGLSLQIWKRGLWDAIFRTGIKTGDSEIDRKLCICTNLPNEILTLLKDNRIKSFLLDKKYSLSITKNKNKAELCCKVSKVSDALGVCYLVENIDM